MFHCSSSTHAVITYFQGEVETEQKSRKNINAGIYMEIRLYKGAFHVKKTCE